MIVWFLLQYIKGCTANFPRSAQSFALQDSANRDVRHDLFFLLRKKNALRCTAPAPHTKLPFKAYLSHKNPHNFRESIKALPQTVEKAPTVKLAMPILLTASLKKRQKPHILEYYSVFVAFSLLVLELFRKSEQLVDFVYKLEPCCKSTAFLQHVFRSLYK